MPYFLAIFSNDTLFYRDKVILTVNRVVNQGEVSRVLAVFWYRKAGIVASSNKVICDMLDMFPQQLLLFLIDNREGLVHQDDLRSKRIAHLLFVQF